MATVSREPVIFERITGLVALSGTVGRGVPGHSGTCGKEGNEQRRGEMRDRTNTAITLVGGLRQCGTHWTMVSCIRCVMIHRMVVVSEARQR